MESIPIGAARDRLIELADRAAREHDHFTLTRNGRSYAAGLDGRLPPEAVHVFLTCWTRLYGMLCMEILRQLDFAYWDTGPVFEQTLSDICSTLDCPYQPPNSG